MFKLWCEWGTRLKTDHTCISFKFVMKSIIFARFGQLHCTFINKKNEKEKTLDASLPQRQETPDISDNDASAEPPSQDDSSES